MSTPFLSGPLPENVKLSEMRLGENVKLSERRLLESAKPSEKRLPESAKPSEMISLLSSAVKMTLGMAIK